MNPHPALYRFARETYWSKIEHDLNRAGSRVRVLNRTDPPPGYLSSLWERRDVKPVVVGRFLCAVGKEQMSETSREDRRVEAERARQVAEHERENVEQTRTRVEEGRVTAESSRMTAEHFRVLAEEAREVSERLRRDLESVRQETEALRAAAEDARHAAEEARHAAEETRHATIATVAATADALSTSLAQMQFLEDARNTLRQVKLKPGDIH